LYSHGERAVSVPGAAEAPRPCHSRRRRRKSSAEQQDIIIEYSHASYPRHTNQTGGHMSSPSYNGSCLCGAIRFRVRGELGALRICYCQQCRKAQGGPFAAVIPVERAAFEWVAGEDQLQAYESSPGKLRHFCRHCGSPVYSSRASLPQVLRLRAGLLDGPLPLSPASHAYVGAKCNWWPISDDAPQHIGAVPG